jgi:hypothetical protein
MSHVSISQAKKRIDVNVRGGASELKTKVIASLYYKTQYNHPTRKLRAKTILQGVAEAAARCLMATAPKKPMRS